MKRLSRASLRKGMKVIVKLTSYLNNRIIRFYVEERGIEYLPGVITDVNRFSDTTIEVDIEIKALAAEAGWRYPTVEQCVPLQDLYVAGPSKNKLGEFPRMEVK